MIQTSVAEQIIQVVNDLCQKFGIAIDWSVENLVPVAEHLGDRIVDWCIAADIFWIILSGIFFIAGIVCIICAVKCDVEYNLGCGLIVCGVIVSVISGIGICYDTFDLIKCLVFPELKILEYIQTFMQQGG